MNKTAQYSCPKLSIIRRSLRSTENDLRICATSVMVRMRFYQMATAFQTPNATIKSENVVLNTRRSLPLIADSQSQWRSAQPMLSINRKRFLMAS